MEKHEERYKYGRELNTRGLHVIFFKSVLKKCASLLPASLYITYVIRLRRSCYKRITKLRSLQELLGHVNLTFTNTIFSYVPS